eukprot:Hpha_TRINITY_DN30988_c0_g1::TRINITY_DN30988_c0_g1_i1::g.112288::m.112288
MTESISQVSSRRRDVGIPGGVVVPRGQPRVHPQSRRRHVLEHPQPPKEFAETSTQTFLDEAARCEWIMEDIPADAFESPPPSLPGGVETDDSEGAPEPEVEPEPELEPELHYASLGYAELMLAEQAATSADVSPPPVPPLLERLVCR